LLCPIAVSDCFGRRQAQIAHRLSNSHGRAQPDAPGLRLCGLRLQFPNARVARLTGGFGSVLRRHVLSDTDVRAGTEMAKKTATSAQIVTPLIRIRDDEVRLGLRQRHAVPLLRFFTKHFVEMVVPRVHSGRSVDCREFLIGEFREIDTAAHPFEPPQLFLFLRRHQITDQHAVT
jgi:hypothetical protein